MQSRDLMKKFNLLHEELVGVLDKLIVKGGTTLAAETLSGNIRFVKMELRQLNGTQLFSAGRSTETYSSSITLPDLTSFFDSDVEDIMIKVILNFQIKNI